MIKEEEEKQKQLEYIKIKEWEEKFDENKKSKNRMKLEENKGWCKRNGKKSKYDEINEDQ